MPCVAVRPCCACLAARPDCPSWPCACLAGTDDSRGGQLLEVDEYGVPLTTSNTPLPAPPGSAARPGSAQSESATDTDAEEGLGERRHAGGGTPHGVLCARLSVCCGTLLHRSAHAPNFSVCGLLIDACQGIP
jgi:hypothetical protein